MIGKIFNISWPAMMENFAYSTAMMVYNMIIVHLGTVTIASNTILFDAESISYMPGLVFQLLRR